MQPIFVAIEVTVAHREDDPSRDRNQPNGARAHFGGKPVRRLACHRSTFSRFGASGKLGAVRDRRVRTLLYEAANVMLTRYKGQLKLKDWAFAIARRSTMRKAHVALARRLAIIMHAMLRDGTAFISA